MPACGQRAGIYNASSPGLLRGHQVRSVAGPSLRLWPLFSMDRARFLDIARRSASVCVSRRELLEATSHTLDSPEQVHSRRPRLGDRPADA